MLGANPEYAISTGSALSRTKRLGRLAATAAPLRPSCLLLSMQCRSGSTRRTQSVASNYTFIKLLGCISRSSSTRREFASAVSLRFELMHPTSITRTIAMRAPSFIVIIHRVDCDFACARSAPRPRSTSAIFACVILAGSLFHHTNPLALSTCDVSLTLHVHTLVMTACALSQMLVSWCLACSI